MTVWPERAKGIHGRRQTVRSWALSRQSSAHVVPVGNAEECADLIRSAQREGLTIAARGHGCSFADANQSHGHVLADIRLMRRILAWDRTTGVMNVEPGVTFSDLILTGFADGWSPPCVPGGQHITVGGAISANVHGKDGHKLGNFGTHVRKMKLLTAKLDVLEVTPERTPDLFQAVVGGMGLLGVILEAEIQMHPIPSAKVLRRTTLTNSARDSLALLEQLKDQDFLIAWVDALSPAPKLGRGFVSAASWTNGPPVAPHRLSRSLETPATMFGVIPARLFWGMLAPVWHAPAVRVINAAYLAGIRMKSSLDHRDEVLFTEQNFMHNTVPDVNLVYGSYGLFEIQALLPWASGADALDEIINLCNRLDTQSLMCGIKMHRADNMMLSFARDGFTFGIDLERRGRDLNRLKHVSRQLYEWILRRGGLVYLAKDEFMPRDIFEAMYPRHRDFKKVKASVDPNMTFMTDLGRRLLF